MTEKRTSKNWKIRPAATRIEQVRTERSDGPERALKKLVGAIAVPLRELNCRSARKNLDRADNIHWS